ncbi:DUF6919 domain-containing protein [Streptomyces omiyaensis]|uniref:DUF6919 domain-containing protein n=1 Tax=Streptomyces omiyaensis TaxID=68247 RepID=UPI001675EFF0|nr:hypothetical protein [Streptomyces omiyaensis]
MSIRDRRRWKNAATWTEVGELMARWLEGEIASRPGYAARYGPDEETEHLVPTLAAACRAGYITTVSQPGEAGTTWEQRAAVTGLVTDPGLLDRLTAAALAEGLVARVDDHTAETYSEPYIVTTVDGEPFTAFGGYLDRANLTLVEWRGLRPELVEQAATGVYLTLAAPEWGAAGERLWPLLDRVTGPRSENASRAHSS